jgi:hypothetical protein
MLILNDYYPAVDLKAVKVKDITVSEEMADVV